MFRKILIANRGEIACRVMATANRLGIRTVAVYSDADVNSKHVAMADEAIHIGPAAVAESYLRGDRIIEAALNTGAEAVHPGYGFLSENPDFVDAVEGAGLTFIGPPASAIRAMGLKDAAKALMQEAGVPVVPGYHGENRDADFLANEAGKIGFPVLIKARAGGGGKGMRLVETPNEFAAALEGAQREGEASFGDPVCLIEKYITQPRHIEIQVFGDGHGNAVYLFERDCSMQRRHQKVIEEAPAPNMPETVRTAMGKAAVEAAKAIGYQGAGTVEFIVDGSGPLREDGFWFMEMNTRLQVEHPVSEAITGLDFVELQLRVAAGEALPFSQDDLSIDGWSFEARLYAEDVPKGFLPAIGTLNHLRFPRSSEFDTGHIRIDSGVRKGDAISPWYDPMIAKIIVHGPTRAVALNMLTTALADCQISGVVTNLEFLGALARHGDFAQGNVDTGLIARELNQLTEAIPPSNSIVAAAAIIGAGLVNEPKSSDPWDQLMDWRHWTAAQHHVGLEFEGDSFDLLVTTKSVGTFKVEENGSVTEIGISKNGEDVFDILTDGQRFSISAVQFGRSVAIFRDGRSYTFTLPDHSVDVGGEQPAGNSIVAPMPGLVKVVSVQSGSNVSKGDPVIVLEAMKMEHTLTAPRDGKLSEVLVAVGDQVTEGTLLIAMDGDDG